MRSNVACHVAIAGALLQPVLGCAMHRESSMPAPMNNLRRSTPNPIERTAITDVRLFNGCKFTLPQTICLEGGYIEDIGQCVAPAVTFNGTGKFLIPGLIDAHLHLTDVQSLENFTSYGATTAFHMNCGNYTQCHINAQQPGLADFMWAGASAVGNGSAHAKNTPNRPNNTIIFPDTNVTAFVEWQFNNGSDYHKITAEVDGPSLAQQIEMVRTAHVEYNKQTMTHASAISAYKDAANSRTDGIQHVPDDGILPADLIAQIKRQGQFVTPTINVFQYAYGNPTLEQYFDVQPGGNRTLEHAKANARLLYEAGVPLIAGTDSVGSGVPGQFSAPASVPWGYTIHQELQHFVYDVGMAPAEAINAATREAAKWHRLGDRGTIEIGKRADLVMLNSNPLVNISNTLDLEMVWVKGVEVSMIVKL